MTPPLPRRPGTAIFAGGGAWQPRRPQRGTCSEGVAPTDDAIVLADPVSILVAAEPAEVPALLEEVQRHQAEERYVAGYLAYEAGAAFGLAVRPPAGARAPGEALPLAWMAVYDPASATRIPMSDWRCLLSEVDVSGVAAALAGVEPALSVTRDEYARAIARVRECIAAGDTYQVNYTVRGRFSLGDATTGYAPGAGAAPSRLPAIDPLDYFLGLVIRQPVPYAAYLDLGDTQVISLSPELFVRRDGRRLESRPMKGTRPRGATHAEDVALAYELAETEKERAENLMIVDMVRNDLGRVCRAGSIRVPTLFAVEPYRTVWQMVSTVIGEVNPNAGLADIMQAAFPGASITGAPKHHTMEIIAELETEPRDVYTGAVGLFSPGGDFTTNIAIRTITHHRGHCRLGIGSGVVWDSAASAEYDETLVKASFATPPAVGAPPRGGPWRPDPKALLREAATTHDEFYLFETVLLEAATEAAAGLTACGLAGPAVGRAADPALSALHSLSDEAILARYRFLPEHLDRMASSAGALGLPFAVEAAREVMVGLARVNADALVARIQVDAGGHFSLSTRDVPSAAPEPVTLMVSPFRTDPDDPFLAHKTSVRGFYNREHRRALSLDSFDAVFVNRLDHVTEGAITSLFARFGNEWVTPPVEDGLLPGVWRAWYLAHTGATQRPLTLAELRAADEIVVGNSVRGSVRVAELTAVPLVF